MKNAHFLLIALACLPFVACSGSPGDTYLKYYWNTAPLYLYDANPSTPQLVTNDSYFMTKTGTFYMDYTAWDGSSWWMDYTIEANPGSPFFQNGAAAYFEIDLFYFGPGFYEWSYARSIEIQGLASGPETVAPSASKGDVDMAEQPLLGTREAASVWQTVTKNGYTLRLEAGRIAK
jgi:hypothetical protein